jgi:hypothetical protein
MIYDLQKRKSFSEDVRRGRSILNGTVDLHVQAADTIEILPVSESDNIRLMSPESGDGIRPPSPKSGDQSDPNLAIWPNPGRPWPERPDPGRPWPKRPIPDRQAGSGQNIRLAGRIWPDPAILDSDETVRIPAFISNSGYISRNQVKMVKILSASDRISSSMIFILFYINIYMF